MNWWAEMPAFFWPSPQRPHPQPLSEREDGLTPNPSPKERGAIHGDVFFSAVGGEIEIKIVKLE